MAFLFPVARDMIVAHPAQYRYASTIIITNLDA
jgi:hypothetical protein